MTPWGHIPPWMLEGGTYQDNDCSWTHKGIEQSTL